MTMSLTGERFAKTSAVAQVIRDGSDRLNALPVVEVAGATCCVPLQGGLGLPFVIEGRRWRDPSTAAAGSRQFPPPFHGVQDSCRAWTGLHGSRRRWGAQRGPHQPGHGRQYWPNGDPLNDRITVAKGLPQLEDPTRQIIGIVGESGSRAQYRTATHGVRALGSSTDAHNANLVGFVPLSWIVRARGEPSTIVNAVQTELRYASGGLPVARPRTWTIVVQSTARSDFNTFLLSTFAGSALLLAAIGIYGLMAYSVQQRTQEIGVRLALGADSHIVRNMIIRQGMSFALAGVALGLASAFGLTRVISSSLFGVTARDPLVFITVPLLLSAVALFGVWLPARRAARVDPLVALRYNKGGLKTRLSKLIPQL